MLRRGAVRAILFERKKRDPTHRKYQSHLFQNVVCRPTKTLYIASRKKISSLQSLATTKTVNYNFFPLLFIAPTLRKGVSVYDPAAAAEEKKNIFIYISEKEEDEENGRGNPAIHHSQRGRRLVLHFFLNNNSLNWAAYCAHPCLLFSMPYLVSEEDVVAARYCY